MGYIVNWEVKAPESFQPSGNTDAQEKVRELQDMGYDVSVNKSNAPVEWTDEGFKYDGIPWYRASKDPNKYYHGELTVYAEEVFADISQHYEGLFVLDGTNPDGGCFRVFCKDGKSYSVSPQFPEFDESKLE